MSLSQSVPPTLSLPLRSLRGVRAATHLARGIFIPKVPAPSGEDPLAVWCRDLLLRLGVRMEISGADFPSGPCLLVSNHVSWMDILVIRALLPARFIAKEEIALWPLVGRSAQAAGTFFIARKRLSSFRNIFEQVRVTLENEECVAVFPEGTTTCGERLLPFRSGLFEAAIRTGRPVLPLCLNYETPDRRPLRSIAYTGGESFARSFWRTLGEPLITVRIQVFSPLFPMGRSRRELSLESWNILRSALQPSS
ncbi:MAG: lysophospholipid acyltransferase family protein [Nitrospiraceae bacterium]|nr:1-acyl-sn-glycerol-3-phosphate acyltransferase [Nitrospirota bacterium]MDA8150866.1 lysophospholipid acyltransferase family protein [Nitrospiraceae bacterium]